jgi:hypothetical protein
MRATKEKPEILTLDPARNPDAKVLVNDGSGLVVMGIGDAVASCVAGHRAIGSAREEVGHIVESLKEWHRRHSADIAVLHVIISQGKVTILCSPRAKEYDFALGDQLAALNMELTTAYRLFMFDSLQCPVEGFPGFGEFKGIPGNHAN